MLVPRRSPSRLSFCAHAHRSPSRRSRTCNTFCTVFACSCVSAARRVAIVRLLCVRVSHRLVQWLTTRCGLGVEKATVDVSAFRHVCGRLIRGVGWGGGGGVAASCNGGVTRHTRSCCGSPWAFNVFAFARVSLEPHYCASCSPSRSRPPLALRLRHLVSPQLW